MATKNKYKIERKYITNRLARSRQKNNVKFLVAHETANNSTGAEGHYKYFQNITIEASAHTFIDDKKILEIIPLDEKAWHVMYNNDTRVLGLGYANDHAIGIELCRPGNFQKAYDQYIWYHAYLCKKFSLQPNKHIVSHKVLDPARRSDPQSWLNPNGIRWEQFIFDIQTYFDHWEKTIGNNNVPNKLRVDGYFGPLTIKALQRYFGTPVDGVISKPSLVIKAMQKWLGVKQDGYLGPVTISALQRRLGTIVDGKISKPSLVVKELQRRLNNGYLG